MLNYRCRILFRIAEKCLNRSGEQNMKLLIEEVTQELNNVVSVKGQTGIGSFAGIWMSREFDPEVGKAYYCELSLPEIRGEDMIIKRYQDMPTYTDITLDGSILFKGICHAVEDGSMVVSFSYDWIEAFEFSGVDLRVYDTVKFFLEKEDIKIYPYDVAES